MVSRDVKDSGIEWIAQVPKDWQLVRLKDGYNFEKGKNSSLYTKEYIGTHPGKYPVYSGQTENDGIMGSIDTYDYDLDECLFTTTVGAKVMSPRVLKGRFSLSQNCLIMKSNGSMNNRFVYYTLYPLFDYQKSAIPSYMQPSLRVSDLNKYNFYVPSIHEQQKITAFLDEKVAHIDNIIEDTKKSIENLKAYKQSLITETVTKGLDPNVEMKDSGVEWVGRIPYHWNKDIAKRIFKKEQRDIEYDDIITCFRDGEVTLRKNRRTDGFTISTKEIGYQGIKKGDLVIHQMDAFAGAIGVSDSNGKSTPVYIVCTSSKDYNNYYYAYLLRSYAKVGYIESMARGIRERSTDFRYATFSITPLLVPPIKEQNDIVSYLDSKIYSTDKVITQKEKLITELETYKKSLIYEYVTGKKEVK